MSTGSAMGSASERDGWLPTLQLSAKEVFDLMLASKLEVPTVEPTGRSMEITAMVGLAGKISGLLSIRCTTKSAGHMASRMLGIDASQGSQEMWDAVGEVCNMIAGNFKNKISGLGDGCMLSVPTVITGGDYNLRALASDEISVVLLFEKEPIMISLEVHS